MRFWGLQPDNPILRAEMAYQRRTIPRWLQWFDRFGVVVVALVVGAGITYFPVVTDLYGRYNYTYIYRTMDLLSVLQPVLWITQMLVMVRCLFCGFNSVRKIHGQEWDVLALTGISPRQMFIGKWWGALYTLRGWLLGFGVIKLLVFMVMALNLIIYVYRWPVSSAISVMRILPNDVRPLDVAILVYFEHSLPQLPSLDRIIITSALILAITVLEMMVSTGIGMLGGLIPEKIIGLVGAIILRFTPVVIFTLFPDYWYANGNLLWRWHEYTWFTLADGGATGILRGGLPYRGYSNDNDVGRAILLAFCAVIVMYLAYLLFVYLASYVLLRRRGLLPASSL